MEPPAVHWLGYSLDMTTVTPLDITAVSRSVKRSRKLIKIASDEGKHKVIIGDVKYKVPKIVGVNQDVKSFQGTYITYRSGTEASAEFQADSSLAVRYLAVSGGGSVSYAVNKSFSSDNQFALYSFNSDQYTAGLRDYADSLNTAVLKAALADLPSPFPSKPDLAVEQKYKDFFSRYGTHVIVNTSYGARFQLNVWASNSNSAVNNRFSTSVKAAFNGVVAGGSFDASVKYQHQYQQFQEFMKRTVSVQGGDSSLGVAALGDPTNFANYVAWTKTANTFPNLMAFQTDELWALMRDSEDPIMRRRASDVHAAFKYIMWHPQPYKTAVTMIINSDWAEFGLLTPSARIIPNPMIPLPEKTVYNPAKILWGKEHSHETNEASNSILHRQRWIAH